MVNKLAPDAIVPKNVVKQPRWLLKRIGELASSKIKKETYINKWDAIYLSATLTGYIPALVQRIEYFAARIRLLEKERGGYKEKIDELNKQLSATKLELKSERVINTQLRSSIQSIRDKLGEL